MNKLFIHENHAHERETHTVSTHPMLCFSRLDAHARRDRAASRNLIPMCCSDYSNTIAHSYEFQKFRNDDAPAPPRPMARARAFARIDAYVLPMRAVSRCELTSV